MDERKTCWLCPLICLTRPTSLSSFSLQDSAIVVESFKSGFEPPGDFPFEDYSQNLSRTGSDGTISNTPKGDRDKDVGPGPRSDPKHAMSRTKNKLWLFGKKPKVHEVTDALDHSCPFNPCSRGDTINAKCPQAFGPWPLAFSLKNMLVNR